MSPATAHEVWVTGSHVWDNPPNHDHISVEDTSCSDGHSAYGNWNTTDNRLENYNGCNTTVKKYNVNVTAVRECVDIPAAHDPCSAWG